MDIQRKPYLVGDIIKGTYIDGTEVEGLVTYALDDKCDVKVKLLPIKKHSFYEFYDMENIKNIKIIKCGPNHNIVENTETNIYSSSSGLNTECKDELDYQSDDCLEQKPFTYHFGEPVCNVFERWCNTMNSIHENNQRNLIAITKKILDIQSDVNSLK